MRRIFFLIFVSLICVAAPSVRAQDGFLESEEIEVVKKLSRSTPVTFDDPRAFLEAGGAESAGVKIMVGMRFYNPKDNLIPGAGTDDSLPLCNQSNVRQEEIVNDSPDLDMIDLLFYSYEDKEQMARARSWDRPTAPYLPGDLYNPHSIKDPQQLFARWIRLLCLPTRVRRVYNKEGVALLEYREGLRAWDTQ